MSGAYRAAIIAPSPLREKKCTAHVLWHTDHATDYSLIQMNDGHWPTDSHHRFPLCYLQDFRPQKSYVSPHRRPSTCYAVSTAASHGASTTAYVSTTPNPTTSATNTTSPSNATSTCSTVRQRVGYVRSNNFTLGAFYEENAKVDQRPHPAGFVIDSQFRINIEYQPDGSPADNAAVDAWNDANGVHGAGIYFLSINLTIYGLRIRNHDGSDRGDADSRRQQQFDWMITGLNHTIMAGIFHNGMEMIPSTGYRPIDTSIVVNNQGQFDGTTVFMEPLSLLVADNQCAGECSDCPGCETYRATSVLSYLYTVETRRLLDRLRNPSSSNDDSGSGSGSDSGSSRVSGNGSGMRGGYRTIGTADVFSFKNRDNCHMQPAVNFPNYGRLYMSGPCVFPFDRGSGYADDVDDDGYAGYGYSSYPSFSPGGVYNTCADYDSGNGLAPDLPGLVNDRPLWCASSVHPDTNTWKTFAYCNTLLLDDDSSLTDAQ